MNEIRGGQARRNRGTQSILHTRQKKEKKKKRQVQGVEEALKNNRRNRITRRGVKIRRRSGAESEERNRWKEIRAANSVTATMRWWDVCGWCFRGSTSSEEGVWASSISALEGRRVWGI
jgi:hypothetical protein